ncbi:hypothetical protein H0H81_001824 [Sphagnurus paluster]|uniref:Uncharacterized protein n=1 Tax=Sphagnurus paluster TaxID=117069 RepID=A0A9P7GNB0_9AGAR|nr:hypothetical protein H0H81_001824 [Sphagnurus paluster]
MPLPVSSLGVAIVTGAARGIGRGIALRLAKDGYDVGLNDLPAAAESLDNVRKEIIALGRRPFVAFGDVSVPADVEKTVSTVVENLGPLNVMVANAGIYELAPMIEHEVSDFEKHFSVNAIGVFLSYKYAALQMIKQGLPGTAAYSASKFAIRGMTQVAAKEWASHGIRVNAYCPGVIETEGLKELSKNLPDNPSGASLSCALGYNGTPDEVASLVSYLVSKEAHYITGDC